MPHLDSSPSDTRSATERTFRFGRLAASWLRKHGWIALPDDSLGALGTPIARSESTWVIRQLREPDVEETFSQPGFYEGPFTFAHATRLRIDLHDHTARAIDVFNEAGARLGTLCYPSMDVRAIPPSRGIQSDPRPLRATDGRWHPETVHYQSIEPKGPWRPVLWARPVGETTSPLPVAVCDGTRLLLGIPFFDIAVGSAAFPPLDAGYWAHRDCPDLFELEAWCADMVGELLIAARRPGIRVSRWPTGFDAALTVRHDYDRLVSDEILTQLIHTYASLGVRSSWGFLIDKAPRAHAERLEAAGHEVMLHSVAGSEEALRAEIRALVDATGCQPTGSTAHGGLGAAGYLGEYHFRWAGAVGFSYAEILGRRLGVPAQAILTVDGEPSLSSVLLPSGHRSLDLTTKPDGHALQELRLSVPAAIARREHVVVMNHPDIHREELFTLLREIDRSRVWCATFRTIVEWSNAAKFQARVDATTRRVTFGSPLNAPATLEVFREGTRWLAYAECGARALLT